MSNPYVGEIRMFAGNFAPANWALCDGTLLPIVQNPVLFTLIGTTYGGDGVQTFALPDLRGRVPVHAGSGGVIGQQPGSEQATLTVTHVPQHIHTAVATTAAANAASGPSGSLLGAASAPSYLTPETATSQFASSALAPAGGGVPHDNMAPYLPINFIIALAGIFPSRA